LRLGRRMSGCGILVRRGGDVEGFLFLAFETGIDHGFTCAVSVQ
jgi:hypothetical protein